MNNTSTINNSNSSRNNNNPKLRKKPNNTKPNNINNKKKSKKIMRMNMLKNTRNSRASRIKIRMIIIVISSSRMIRLWSRFKETKVI